MCGVSDFKQKIMCGVSGFKQKIMCVDLGVREKTRDRVYAQDTTLIHLLSYNSPLFQPSSICTQKHLPVLSHAKYNRTKLNMPNPLRLSPLPLCPQLLALRALARKKCTIRSPTFILQHSPPVAPGPLCPQTLAPGAPARKNCTIIST